MSTLTLTLDDLDWAEVARSAGEFDGQGDVPRTVLADALSLSALFSDDFLEGRDRITRARRAEPLNPIHEVREILLLLRFGATASALDLARDLQDRLPGIPLPGYLRALASLLSGEPRRAANAAAEVVEAHPNHGLARFLQAESQLRTQFKGLRKLLAGLPRGQAHAPAWLDLASKMMLIGGEEASALAAEVVADSSRIPPGSRERALGDELLALGRDGLEALEGKLADAPTGSRAEEIILVFWNDLLDDHPTPAGAIEVVQGLFERFPDRSAVRRIYVARLTRLAVDLAGREEYAEALRVVERCLQLEPQEAVHHQNRAALFTLLRELDAYHDAWADLDRHQYRLALLGRIRAEDAQKLARTHRLFAQQARLPAEGLGLAASRGDLGLFKRGELRAGEGGESVLVVNNTRIDDDPELLRQWLHHRRAELTFLHWSLGTEARRFLLEPESIPVARARLASLKASSSSLGVLVPEEGRLLARRLVAAWERRFSRLEPGYAAPTGDDESLGLRLLHLETFADLASLCLSWNPKGSRVNLVEDVVSMLLDEAAFFDDSLHREILQAKQGEPSYPLKLLAGFLHETLGLDPNHVSPLGEKQREALIGRLAAELFTRLSYRTYEELGGGADGARRALVHVDRARLHDPENIRTELLAARFLLIAGHDDESRATLARLQNSARAREPAVQSEIEELRQVLDEKARSGAVSQVRKADSPGPSAETARSANLSDLLAEVDRFPGSIPAYEELTRKLAAEGRFTEAVDWSERAMTQCLGRDGQLRARTLNIEALGLSKLGHRDQGVVVLYLAGAHTAPLEILEAISEDGLSDYTLDFLMGQCRLALGRPEEARRAFERALERCTRQLHRPALKALAMDVDHPYLVVARRSIADKVGVGEFAAALHEAWAMMARLRRPEAALVDLAQLHLDSTLARLGTAGEPLPSPSGAERELCGGRLAEVYSVNSDLERSRRLARLGLELHEPSRRKLELILRKADALEERAALAEVLARSGQLLRQGDFAAALEALDGAGSGSEAEPRIARQRALLLLKLDRIEEAEAVAEALQGSTSPIAVEFLGSFASMAFRQRIAVASRMLRGGESSGALALLGRAVAGTREEAVELAYCRAFAIVMDAYRARRLGELEKARSSFLEAMDIVEPRVADARGMGHSRLVELYETLDKEIDQ